MYATYTIDSGFVTYANESKIKSSRHIIDFNVIPAHEDQVSKGRLALELKYDPSLLVAISWYHDEELYLAPMFPDFIAYATTFGVTKEQRDLFLFASVDGNNRGGIGFFYFLLLYLFGYYFC